LTAPTQTPGLSELLSALDWTNKVVGFFKPYKPVVKRMRINYRDSTSEIGIHISIPDSLKRRVARVEVPAYYNFYIYEMLAEPFTPLPTTLWQFDGGKWKLDPKHLPRVDNFFLVMRGRLPPGMVGRLVRVQEARNRNQTESEDNYWLDCMIRDVELFEGVWTALEVQDIDVGVNVAIDACFSSILPKEYSKKVDAVGDFLRAGHGKSRQEVFKAWGKLRSTNRIPGKSVDEFLGFMMRMTTGELFSQYLSVDKPFNLGLIKRDDKVVGPAPKRMLVEALTDLTTKQPVANGNLSFKKKEYTQKVKSAFEGGGE